MGLSEKDKQRKGLLKKKNISNYSKEIYEKVSEDVVKIWIRGGKNTRKHDCGSLKEE